MLTLLFSGFHWVDSSYASEIPDKVEVITSSQAAISLASTYFGVAVDSGSGRLANEPSATTAILNDSTIPIYIDSIGQISRWTATIPSVLLKPDRPCSVYRDYDLIMHGLDGKLLKFASVPTTQAGAEVRPDYPADSLAMLLGAPAVRIQSVGTTSPRLSIAEVLGLASPSRAFSAARTTGYVFEIIDEVADTGGSQPLVVWCVVTYHIPAFRSSGYNSDCQAESYANCVTLIRDDNGQLYTVLFIGE